jgi:DNA-binding CsgD family transcriptional regulator
LALPQGLLERDSELGTIESVVDAGSSGGRLLAIEGPPGIGKTALMSEVKAMGLEAGMRVLSGRGSELERSFSYGVVRQLFEPLLATLAGEERAELLAGAAVLAAPLFDPDQVAAQPTADTSLATLHGLYWLTANLAARQPVLIAIDDLHWCDLPTLRWLAYMLPRMEGLVVTIIVGLRPEEPGEHPLVAQILSDPLAAVLRPAPLSVEATTHLLRETLSPDAEDAFCAACWEETGGNPLLLRELTHTIAAERLAPTDANATRLCELAGAAGSRAVSMRLSRLAPEATMLARAVAILGDDADLRQAAALAGLDERTASEMARALAQLDVLRPRPPLGFVHPLIGAAVYDSVTPHERDTRHARAARLLISAAAEPERVAAHLLRSPPAADAGVVATLRKAAGRAGSRGASENAVAYLRRALAEPPPPAERVGLLLELGSAEALVDGDAAIEHLREAHELIDAPVRRSQVALMLGRQLFLLRGEEADRVFIQALDELAGAEPELANQLEVGIITNGLFAPALHRDARQRLVRVRRHPADQTIGEKLLLSQLAYHDARAGGPAADVVALARRAVADGTLVRADVSGAMFPLCTVLGMADLDEVLTIYEDLLAEAHRRGSIFALAAVKVFRAQTLVWRGDLTEAESDARDALTAAAAWGPSARLAIHGSAFLADALMEQGRLEEAVAVLHRPELDAALPESARLLYLRDSRARLRMMRGDLTGGLEEMLEAGRQFDYVCSFNPAFIAWRSPAALALHQLGEEDEARRLAHEELELARIWGAPRALGAALRVAGLIDGGEEGLALLGEAVEVLSGSPAKLEHAKARTELGAALRRANHRLQARDQLRRAVELATICGAAALAARAETELLATGARPRRLALDGIESLTPSERRVAEMAAHGPSNREIAQALFITQRTVEVHLTSAYRKLGISSRLQLAAALDIDPGS